MVLVVVVVRDLKGETRSCHVLGLADNGGGYGSDISFKEIIERLTVDQLPPAGLTGDDDVENPNEFCLFVISQSPLRHAAVGGCVLEREGFRESPA